MTDFSGGSWRSLITGDTVSAIPDSAIDYFEDGNLNNYEGDLDAFSITSNSLSGQYSLLMNSDPFVVSLSLSGLDKYPVKGDIVSTTPDNTVATIPDNTVAHYDASQLSLNDGDTVSVWPDEQGDNDLDTQTGSPTYVESGINGNPAIAFNGDGLEGTGFSVTQPNTTYVVFEYQSDFDGGRVLSGVSERQLTVWARDGGKWRTYAGMGDYVVGSTDIGIQQMTTVFDGGNSIIREDGVETAVGDLGYKDLGGLSVGYDSYGYDNFGNRNYADAYVSEIVIVNSGSVDLDFETQLLEKWGITA